MSLKAKWQNLSGLVFVFSIACSSSSSEDLGIQAPIDNPDGGTIDGGGDPEVQVSASKRQRVRFKGAERFRNDLAQALSLEPSMVCLELGQFDCVDRVHTITLGGVEPYILGVTTPAPQSNATTTLAIERVALSACGAAIDRDLRDPPTALLLQSPLQNAGRLNETAIEPYVTELYRRVLLRNPTSSEIGHHRELYATLEADGQERPGRDWAVLSCFMAATSEEGLFY